MTLGPLSDCERLPIKSLKKLVAPFDSVLLIAGRQRQAVQVSLAASYEAKGLGHPSVIHPTSWATPPVAGSSALLIKSQKAEKMARLVPPWSERPHRSACAANDAAPEPSAISSCEPCIETTSSRSSHEEVAAEYDVSQS